MSTTDTDTFFGAIDPRTVMALPAGALIQFTYDELGARRDSRYHTILGVVRATNKDAERGVYVSLVDITVTRPNGDTSHRDSFNYRAQNIMALTVLEAMAF